MYRIKSTSRLISPILEYALNDSAKNSKQYEKFLAEGLEPLAEAYSDAFLYGKGRRYFVLDHVRKKVTYYMEWRERTVLEHSAAYQIMVWSDAGVADIRGFAAEVFYDVLFEDHEVIVTDKVQTPDGKRFWDYVVTLAFERNYPVYLINLLDKTSTRLTSFEEVKEQAEYIWPEKEVGKSRLLCVTKEPIWG